MKQTHQISQIFLHSLSLINWDPPLSLFWWRKLAHQDSLSHLRRDLLSILLGQDVISLSELDVANLLSKSIINLHRYAPIRRSRHQKRVRNHIQRRVRTKSGVTGRLLLETRICLDFLFAVMCVCVFVGHVKSELFSI